MLALAQRTEGSRSADRLDKAKPSALSNTKIAIVGLVVVLVTGSFLRLPSVLFDPKAALYSLNVVHPNARASGVGFDEALYRDYTDKLRRFGLGAYPEIVERYREKQATLPGSILPPVRFFYIFAAASWQTLFGGDTLSVLKDVASFFSVATLLLACVFACRLLPLAKALGVVALFAFLPTQLHMSQHALVDGVFTFWALLTLWLFWENLHAPRRWPWLAAYVISLAGMVLTKENAFFVWIALIAILFANRWLKLGEISGPIWIATLVGPLLGVVVLIFLVGGIGPLIATYQLSVTKNYTLEYAILTGDGPWQRYLLDLLLVSPIVTLLALTSVFSLRREHKPAWFFTIFIASSYLVMCNVKYGMNLRYANMWDFGLCFLALWQLDRLSTFLSTKRTLALAGSVAVLCATEVRTYLNLAVDYPLYELVTPELMRAQKILKSRADLLPPPAADR